MSKKTKILVIISLLLFVMLDVCLTNIYENRIILKDKKIEVQNQFTPFKKTLNYKSENKERYVAYYENNSNLSYEEVVTFVNIGLDKGFYNYINSADIKKGNLILVNKFHKLDKSFVPSDLETIDNKYFINGNPDVRNMTKDAKNAFEKLSEASIKNNTPVYGQSAYRSYDVQDSLYNNALSVYGKDKADLEIARPGHSEHQTGLAIDVSSNKSGNMLDFGNTPSYIWMINNAHKYGFILRYTENDENIHGYINEPWHFRYVGVEVATDIYNNYSNLTYDEYYYKFIDNK